MKNAELIQILTKETQSLKEQYLQMTETWAKERHAIAVAMSKWKELDWCKYFGLEPQVYNAGTPMQFLSFPSGFYNTRQARIFKSEKDRAVRMYRTGIDEYVSDELKKAEDHYCFSIEKLAYRLDKKGLRMHCLQIITAHVGVNIETTLTDGLQTVRAFTVLAYGEIQRPHYRYLIK